MLDSSHSHLVPFLKAVIAGLSTECLVMLFAERKAKRDPLAVRESVFESR